MKLVAVVVVVVQFEMETMLLCNIRFGWVRFDLKKSVMITWLAL